MGPILELSGVKMHLSKGYKSTTVRKIQKKRKKKKDRKGEGTEEERGPQNEEEE